MALVSPARARLLAPRARGFTLVEVLVVVAIIAILALAALTAMWETNPRQAISLAPKMLASALETARNYAQSRGNNVVFLFLADDGKLNAGRCGLSGGPVEQDSHCIRYWILEDRGGAAARFNDTARDSFDPNTHDDSTGETLTSQGDKVLDFGTLPRFVYVGTGPVYRPRAASNTSALLDIALDTPGCSFCSGGGRGYITFTPTGQVITGPTGRGAIIYLNAYVAEDERVFDDTRAVIILQPSGIVLDRAMNK